MLLHVHEFLLEALCSFEAFGHPFTGWSQYRCRCKKGYLLSAGETENKGGYQIKVAKL